MWGARGVGVGVVRTKRTNERTSVRAETPMDGGMPQPARRSRHATAAKYARVEEGGGGRDVDANGVESGEERRQEK